MGRRGGNRAGQRPRHRRAADQPSSKVVTPKMRSTGSSARRRASRGGTRPGRRRGTRPRRRAPGSSPRPRPTRASSSPPSRSAGRTDRDGPAAASGGTGDVELPRASWRRTCRRRRCPRSGSPAEPRDPLLGRAMGPDSGRSGPVVASWIRSSPTAAAALSASSMSPGSMSAAAECAQSRPGSRPAAPGAPTGRSSRRVALGHALDLVADADDGLDVVAVLVGHDVGDREVAALRAEAATAARRRSRGRDRPSGRPGSRTGRWPTTPDRSPTRCRPRTGRGLIGQLAGRSPRMSPPRRPGCPGRAQARNWSVSFCGLSVPPGSGRHRAGGRQAAEAAAAAEHAAEQQEGDDDEMISPPMPPPALPPGSGSGCRRRHRRAPPEARRRPGRGGPRSGRSRCFVSTSWSYRPSRCHWVAAAYAEVSAGLASHAARRGLARASRLRRPRAGDRSRRRR